MSETQPQDTRTPHRFPFACIGPMVYRTSGADLTESVAQCGNGHTAVWLCEQLNLAAVVGAVRAAWTELKSELNEDEPESLACYCLDDGVRHYECAFCKMDSLVVSLK